MEQICDDTAAEHAALDSVVSGLDPDEWRRPTPAAGWTIADQISHLWFFDQRALLALTDPDAFLVDREALLARTAGGQLTDASVEPGRVMPAPDLLAAWRQGRADLLSAARRADPKARVPWYGPAMAARSFLTARLMETWAHGVDVGDTVGVVPIASPRLRHVAHIGVRARPFSYTIRNLELPAEPYVCLGGPAGDVWEWGTPSLADRVDGPALDFCLVATQRRHLADTSLSTTGESARQWMQIAQAFAGTPGPGRLPLG